MKLKHILIVGLALIILTIGAVSASENTTDVLTDVNVNSDIYIDDEVYEDGNDTIVRIYSPTELSGEISLSVDDKEYFKDNISNCGRFVDNWEAIFSYYYVTQKQLTPNLGIGTYNLTVKYDNLTKNEIVNVYNMIEIKDRVVREFDDETFCRIHDGEYLDGTVKIYLNGKEYFNKQMGEDNDEYALYGFVWSELKLPKDFKFGIYDAKVVYEKKNGKTYTNHVNLSYEYLFQLGAWAVTTATPYPKYIFKTDVSLNIDVPSDAKNKVIVKLNGKTYKVTPKNGEARLEIKDLDLNLGQYTVYATYSDSKYPKTTINDTFSVAPVVEWPAEMSVGQDEYIYIMAPKNSKGTATLYQGNIAEDEDGDQFLSVTKKYATVSIVNGYAAIPLKKLAKGYQHFALDYTIDGVEYHEYEIHIDVIKNTKGFSSSLSKSKIKVGKTVNLNIKAPKGTGKVKIYLNGKLYKTPSLKSGKAKLTLKNLKVGTHKIDVSYSKSKKFYSKTHFVKVKPKTIKLTLKKVKVKRSAKKLVLKSTLKIEGKKAANKKIKFKFNKKTYTAKTNRKGIAKITITKKILKKLKVGDKVTYKAYYGGKTVKRSVEVK